MVVTASALVARVGAVGFAQGPIRPGIRVPSRPLSPRGTTPSRARLIAADLPGCDAAACKNNAEN